MHRAFLDRPVLITVDGQSNMVGHLGTGGARIENPLVFCYELFPTGEGQTTGWKSDGMNGPNYPFSATGNSIFYHVADIVQRATGRAVCVVCHAVGGMPIREWWGISKAGNARIGVLYSRLYNSLQYALDLPLPGRPDGKTLRQLGITAADVHLRHQGESDADYVGGSFAGYRQSLLELVTAYRTPSTLGIPLHPMIRPSAPFICGELLIGGTSPSTGSPTDDRNDALRDLAEIGAIRLAPADGLTAVDTIHFDGPSLVELARRYAALF